MCGTSEPTNAHTVSRSPSPRAVRASARAAGVAGRISVSSYPFSATTSRAARWLSDVMVVAEVALALVLVIGAGLLLRSFVKLSSIDPIGDYSASGRILAIGLSSGWHF